MQQIIFSAKVWLYPGDAAWHFISLPKKMSAEIAARQAKKERRGWGAVKIQARVGATIWETSMFPESKSGCYIIPLKRDIREKEGIMKDDTIRARVQLI